MPYLVLARKWRPRTFEELIGQEAIGRTLMNAIQMKRVAHAFLFTGARGVGKTSAARILAMCLCCENLKNAQSCGECSPCAEILRGDSLDVLEIDGASHTGVDAIREVIANVQYLPTHGKYKVYIIDEVHMLSTSAFNALLKTLEEPPTHVIFIFATTEPHKVPITVQSRCQRFDFKRIPPAKIERQLSRIAESEGIHIEPQACSLIANKAEGSMRDALGLLDQMVAYTGENVSKKIVAELLGLVDTAVARETVLALLKKDLSQCLKTIGAVYEGGYDLKAFVQELLSTFRNLALAVAFQGRESQEEWGVFEREGLIGAAEQADIQRAFLFLLDALERMAHSPYPLAILEMACARLILLPRSVSIEEVLQKMAVQKNGKEEFLQVTPSVIPPSSPLPPSSPSHPVDFEKRWSEFLIYLQKEKPHLASVLAEVSLLKGDMQEIMLGAPDDSFCYRYLDDGEHKSEIQALTLRFFGKKIPISIQNTKQATVEGVRLSQKELREKAQQHHLIQHAMKMFEVETMDIKVREE